MKKNANKTRARNNKPKAQQAEIIGLAERAAINSAAFFNVVRRSLDGIIIVDQEKMVIYTNNAGVNLFDSNIIDFLGKSIDLNFDTIDSLDNPETIAKLKIPNRKGGVTTAEVSVFKTEWNNQLCLVAIFHDISEQEHYKEKLNYIATHDYLTNLTNRNYFETQMNRAIEYAKEHKQHMALIYLDLDDFKRVNDSLGHVVGDNLLKKIATLLVKNSRKGDTVTRLGGDEFAIIIHALRKPHYAAIISQTILNKLDTIQDIDGKELYISASIGIAVYPFCGKNAVDLLKNADSAMYSAKTKGKNQYCFFTKELSQQTEKNILIINGLKHAARRDELHLLFQPIIELEHSTCVGIEALVRWNHPQLGLILPETFLPYAEAVGAMLPINRCIFEQALDAFSRMDLKTLLFISINMSASEFIIKDEEHFIISTIDKWAVPAKKLILELTETVIMTNPLVIIEKMQVLANLGVRIAIDDYGIGYSSLSLLKQLPAAILKIDKSFIADIGKDLNNTIIVKSTIQLAHNLGLKIIAEGVETKEQLTFLKEHGCDYGQGYYFSKPVDFDQLTKYISGQ